MPDLNIPAGVVLSNDSRTTAGILLLTILAVEYGGVTVLRIVRGRQPATELQKTFARAGHAHAGVLVLFALITQVLRWTPLSRARLKFSGCLGWVMSWVCAAGGLAAGAMATTTVTLRFAGRDRMTVSGRELPSH